MDGNQKHYLSVEYIFPLTTLFTLHKLNVDTIVCQGNSNTIFNRK